MKEKLIPVFFDTKSSSATQHREALKGIRAAALRAGLHVQLISEQDIDNYCFDDSEENAIIASDSMPFVRHIIHSLRERGRRAVLAGLDSEQFGPDVSCATPSRRAETQQMANYLYSLGRRKFALVGFGLNSINDNFRYHSAMSSLTSLGLSIDERDVWHWQTDPQTSFRSFVSSAHHYDTVICPNDTMSINLINHLRKHGICVPQDLYVASFGNKTVGRYFSPSITSMTMDMVQVGEQAFYVWQFLNAQPDNHGVAIKITVPSRILIRESTGGRIPDDETIVPAVNMSSDPFYSDPSVAPLVNLENCLAMRDELDMRIIAQLMEDRSYETIAETLFISESTLRYRLAKIYASTEIKGRTAFTGFVRSQLGSANPFSEWL